MSRQGKNIFKPADESVMHTKGHDKPKKGQESNKLSLVGFLGSEVHFYKVHQISTLQVV
jgi:hypothetical protein